MDNPHRPLLEAVKDTTGEEASLGRVEQRGQSWVNGTEGSVLGEWNRVGRLGRVEQRGQSWVNGTGWAGLGEWNREVSLG